MLRTVVTVFFNAELLSGQTLVARVAGEAVCVVSLVVVGNVLLGRFNDHFAAFTARLESLLPAVGTKRRVIFNVERLVGQFVRTPGANKTVWMPLLFQRAQNTPRLERLGTLGADTGHREL